MSDELPAEQLANAAVVSPRWVEWRRTIDLGAYDERFASMAGSGTNVHGEAEFIGSFTPASILDAGCGTGRIAIELARRGFEVMGVDLDADMIAAARAKAPDIDWRVEDLARMQLPRRFDLIAMPGNVMIFCQPADRRLIVHNMAQHLVPGGLLIAGFTLEPDGYTLAEWDEHCTASGFTLVERYSTWDRRQLGEPAEYHVSVHRRSDRFTVHDLVAEARAGLQRLSPSELFDARIADPAIVVIDTRETVDRQQDGTIAGSVHAPWTVVAWRADPSSGYSHPAITGFDQQLVVVCNDGYSSSLAAANLQRLGFANATDLIGGFRAWQRAGLPVELPPG